MYSENFLLFDSKEKYSNQAKTEKKAKGKKKVDAQVWRK